MLKNYVFFILLSCHEKTLNNYLTSLSGYQGFLLAGIDPSRGSFADTPAVTRGKQLMDLTTKYRNMLEGLMSRVMVSGSHSSGDDLIRCAYDRCGLELRPKDLKLFIFYLTVRGHDLAFCCGILHADESASETTSTSDLSVEVKKETNYAKRQKVKNDQNERRRNSNKQDHAELIKAFTSAPNESMNTSVINMNNMATDESKKNIEYLESAIKSEFAKTKALETDSLIKLISNPDVFLLFSIPEQNEFKKKLATLMIG